MLQVHLPRQAHLHCRQCLHVVVIRPRRYYLVVVLVGLEGESEILHHRFLNHLVMIQ